jgi:putative hemolysin
MNRITQLTLALALSGVVFACRPAESQINTATPTAKPGLANPASVYCQERGYKLELRTAADGSQQGICIFPDGSSCEEWAFFRGECAKATPASGERIAIPDSDLSIAIPDEWKKTTGQWKWTPPTQSGGCADGQHIRVAWQDIQPGREPESILPKNAQMLDRQEGPTLAWGQAATYRLHVLVAGGQGQVQAVETHILVRGARRLYDLAASACNEAQLQELMPSLLQIAHSAAVSE